jgi:hypothetical protein
MQQHLFNNKQNQILAVIKTGAEAWGCGVHEAKQPVSGNNGVTNKNCREATIVTIHSHLNE